MTFGNLHLHADSWKFILLISGRHHHGECWIVCWAYTSARHRKKRSSEPVYVIQLMTVGISGEFPFLFLMLENILVEIHHSLVKHRDGKCRILCVFVLMKFEAFSISMYVLAFSLRIAPFYSIYFKKYQENQHNKHVTQCIGRLNVVPHVLRTVQCFLCYMPSPKI